MTARPTFRCLNKSSALYDFGENHRFSCHAVCYQQAATQARVISRHGPETQNSNCTKMKSLIRNPFILPPVFAFFLVLSDISGASVSLIDRSGDAESIWQTITSFYSTEIQSSYVLYKGFLSVYPYAPLYQLALQWDIEVFALIKIYHAALFSVAAGISVPFIVSRLLSVRITIARNFLFVILIYHLTEFTHIYRALMIDLPAWCFFVTAVASLLRVTIENPLNFLGIAGIGMSGIFVGLCAVGSGQYALSSLLLGAYFFNWLWRQFNREKTRRVALLFSGCLFLGLSVTPKFLDSNFEREIVEPMRQQGAWLPTGAQWVQNGLWRLIDTRKNAYPEVNNRGLAILKVAEGKDFERNYGLLKQGASLHSVSEYVDTILNNFFEFIVMWTTKIFLILSLDGGNASITKLLISYTAVFLSGFLFAVKLRTFRDILRSESLIYFSFIATVFGPVVGAVEMRYVVCMMSLVVGIAVFQRDAGTRIIEVVASYVRLVRGGEAVDKFKDTRVPLAFLAYIAFLLFCFSFYGALLEVPGSDPEKVLFEW